MGFKNLGFLGFFTKKIKTPKVQILDFLGFYEKKLIKSRF